jgi:hypothetical protein
MLVPRRSLAIGYLLLAAAPQQLCLVFAFHAWIVADPPKENHPFFN